MKRFALVFFLLLFTLSPFLSKKSFAQIVPDNSIAPGFSSYGVPQAHTSGPAKDIIEIQTITQDKTAAEVDEPVTFTMTIQNRATVHKLIRELCFESTDGNLGCAVNVSLDPGQIFSLSGTGSFTTGGMKTVWVTWSQDSSNYYRPVNDRTASVRIEG